MRKVMTVVGAVVAVTLLVASVPVLAHHSFAAAFDETKPMNLQGVVTKVELVNPHSWIWIDVKNPDGTVTNWGLEGGPPVNLFRNGVTKNSLAIGSEIKVFAYRAKSGESKGVAVFFDTRMVERCSWADRPLAPMASQRLVLRAPRSGKTRSGKCK